MTHRFYLPTPITGGAATLTGPQAHHLIKVMRASVGDEIAIFDGRGGEWRAQITAMSRSAAELAIVEPSALDRELPFSLSLGVALPKGERQRWLVEKLVELGASRLVPLKTDRGVAQPTSSAQERLRRVVVEACKQCGRNWLMEIDEPQTVPQFVAGAAASQVRLIAHPGGETVAALRPEAESVTAAIGPEGGFTEAETALARQAGWRTVGLGPRILRVETAAVALAAFFSLQREGDGEG